MMGRAGEIGHNKKPANHFAHISPLNIQGKFTKLNMIPVLWSWDSCKKKRSGVIKWQKEDLD